MVLKRDTRKIDFTPFAHSNESILSNTSRLKGDTFYGIRGADGYTDFFTYWSVRVAVDELQRRTHGTIFDTITRQTFKLIETTLVPVDLVDEFESVVTPLMAYIHKNLNESRILSYLRDTLLPKLLSGTVFYNSESEQRVISNHYQARFCSCL